jgi:hypothetical protein
VSYCERDREIDKQILEKTMWSVLHSIHLNVSNATIITANIILFYFINVLVVCVTSKREREHHTKRYGQCSPQVATLPTANGTVLKDFISCKPVFVLRKHVFWVVTPYGWVTASRHSEGTYYLQFQGYESVNWLIMLRLCFFKMPGANYRTTWHKQS